jgi:hypothetical protein
MRVVIGLVAMACACSMGCSNGSANDGAGGSAGGSSYFFGTGCDAACPLSGTGEYNSCLMGRCDSVLKSVYGDGYATGAFSGPCGAYMSCIRDCKCDETCARACMTGATACDSTASFRVYSCGQFYGCGQYLCPPTAPPRDDAGPNTGTCPGPPPIDFDAGGYTCAELPACCAQVTNQGMQANCSACVSVGNDFQCSYFLYVMTTSGSCQ